MKYLLGIIVAAIAVVGIFFVASWFSYSNMGATMEQNVKMTYEDNKVVLNSYTAKVSEAAQVPDMYRDDLQKVIESTFQGRYGENGSQAVFQFINENNMTLEPQLYTKIQQIIESGREDFKVSQKRLVDVTNNYELALAKPYSKFWLNLTGYPTINIKDYAIIVTDDVEQKFKSKRDEVIKLR